MRYQDATDADLRKVLQRREKDITEDDVAALLSKLSEDCLEHDPGSNVHEKVSGHSRRWPILSAAAATVVAVGLTTYVATIFSDSRDAAPATSGVGTGAMSDSGTVEVPLPTSSWDASQPGLTVLYIGEIRRDEYGCVRIYPQGATDSGSPVLWPAGYTAEDQNGTLVISNEEGVEVVRENDFVSTGGVSRSIGRVEQSCEEVGPEEDWWQVESEIG